MNFSVSLRSPMPRSCSDGVPHFKLETRLPGLTVPPAVTQAFASPHLQIHMDGDWAFQTEEASKAAGQAWPHATHSLVVNFGTVDIDATNGGTEIWPRRWSLSLT